MVAISGLIDRSHLGSSIDMCDRPGWARVGQAGRSTEFKQPVRDWEQVVRSRPTRLTRVATPTKGCVRDKHNCLLSQSSFSQKCAQAEHG